jgi:hypothetical protein
MYKNDNVSFPHFHSGWECVCIAFLSTTKSNKKGNDATATQQQQHSSSNNNKTIYSKDNYIVTILFVPSGIYGCHYSFCSSEKR